MKAILNCLLVIAVGLVSAASRADETVTVFAAASMKDALEAVAVEYAVKSGSRPVFSFAATSVLARQIEAGAPADLFISADDEWMDWLAARSLVEPGSRRAVAGNGLVVAVPAGTLPVADPAGLLSSGRFAMGDPAHVPAGRYAHAALESLGLWKGVGANAVFGENVRVALELVRRGEVAAAIVYASDLQTAPELSAAFAFPASSHPPIVYPAARVAGGDARAGDFLEFLSGEAGRRILAAHGFLIAVP